MPKRRDPEQVFQRAREKGSGENNTHIDGSEVQRHREEKTRKAYQRQVDLWNQYAKEHPGASPYDLESLKDFIKNIAFAIDGVEANEPDEELDVNAAKSTVRQYWKDFMAGWQMEHEQIQPKITRSITRFIEDQLPDLIKMRKNKRPRRYTTKSHFLHLGRQMWTMDWYLYESPKTRVSDWADIMVIVCSSARVGEYIESSCRTGSGRDITFRVFRNEHRNVEFAVKVIRDAKNTTQSPDKKPEHSVYEGLVPLPLFCQPLLFILAILIAKRAFKDYETVEELFSLVPPDGEMYPLQWSERVVDQPFFESMSARASPGKIENASAFSKRFKSLGYRSGYPRPPTIHDFRAVGLYLIDKLYSAASRMKYAGQKDSNTFINHYMPNITADGQGSYFGTEVRSLVNDLFLSLTLPRNPKLAQSLPAEKQYEFENSEEYVKLEEEISILRQQTDADSARRRKELYEQRRKLSDKELHKWQKLQPNKLEPGGMENTALEGHHRTIFNRTRFLMPERDRLASSLLEVAPLRSPIGFAALRDLVALCLKETEIEFRPGLEPEKCNCSVHEQELTAYDWKHIYDCYRKYQAAAYSFAELCFLCHNWIFNKSEWEQHCQGHLDSWETLPKQCNPLFYGGVLASPGYCPHCLRDTSLPASVQMYQYLYRNKWKEHINKHFISYIRALDSGQLPECPCPPLGQQCKRPFESSLKLRFHLQDIHCFEFIDEKRRLKRLKPDDEIDTQPVQVKRQRSSYNHKRDVGGSALVKVEYDFIYEIVNTNGLRRRQSRSTAPSKRSTPPSGSSSTLSISLRNGDWVDIDSLASTDTPASSVSADIHERIDPQLCCQHVTPPITTKTALDYEVIDVVKVTSSDEDHSHLLAKKDTGQGADSSHEGLAHVDDMGSDKDLANLEMAASDTEIKARPDTNRSSEIYRLSLMVTCHLILGHLSIHRMLLFPTSQAQFRYH
ncbi:hypothetical protein F5884DRAFT_113557 [Xylogone sp. PMI_703]|nr:hypothetical protein F5884DRAFT_113557 [Xylogone sp. PMI_703]